ncbi:hypothetical protein MKX01_030529 [Papaver californicum]|nr:hypothetical protein MKX01_030529 [Papaver californicum]
MQHRYYVVAVDRCLKDLRSDDRPFGGATIVLGGDFRKTLPVIEKARRGQILGASLRSSTLWGSVVVLELIQNMRLGSQDLENVEFTGFLLQVGTDPKENVVLPSTLHRCTDLKHLISEVYPGIQDNNIPSPQYLTERTILSARNEDVARINATILKIYRIKEHTYIAADKEAETKQDGTTGFTGMSV